MEYKKQEIQEIIDANGELIGSDDIPHSGSDLESAANNTTDYNVKVGHQPYRYDMLGRFGFTLLPFFEGVEGEGTDPLLEDIARYLYDRYMDLLKHYYKNPKALQQDYRKKSTLDFESDESNEHDYEAAKDILELIKPYFEESLMGLDNNLKDNLGESAFIEGKMLDKKEDKDLSDQKSGDSEVLDTQIKKIAGLVNNKLDKKEINKLINLLERE